MKTVTILHGDSRDVIRGMADCSIDSVVCDPPYALVSIVKRFGGKNAAEAKSEGASGVYKRASAGFMGKTWDTGETAFDPDFWTDVMRVLKPGGHLIAASGTRTYHRLAVAIEDAGFEIRDMISWLYGSGFPKSHDVSKGIDRANGDARPVVGESPFASRKPNGSAGVNSVGLSPESGSVITSAASVASAAWTGWGTALKPACEPWVLARKPLAGTVAANVLAHGTGAININGCRVGWQSEADAAAAAAAAAANGFADSRAKGTATQSVSIGKESRDGTTTYDPSALDGRWPANVIHDGSDEVATGFDGALRYFYSAKADADDRMGSKHPTVKPIDLMRYLVRLVTPPGGVVLDPFAGSGSTGVAAMLEGFDSILIEREAEYVADIERKVAHYRGEGGLSSQTKLKARQDEHGDLPLFATNDTPSQPASQPASVSSTASSLGTDNRAGRPEMVKGAA